MCALSETKLKGKGEVMLGDVVGRVSGVAEAGRGNGRRFRCCADQKNIEQFRLP